MGADGRGSTLLHRITVSIDRSINEPPVSLDADTMADTCIADIIVPVLLISRIKKGRNTEMRGCRSLQLLPLRDVLAGDGAANLAELVISMSCLHLLTCLFSKFIC